MLFAILIAWASGVLPRGTNEDEELRRQARAILAENCFDCHGPDAHARKAKLRLDTPEGLFESRKGAAVLLRGKPERSELFVRVSAVDPELRMPPPESKRRLDAAQIETLRRWIAAGAPFGKHWAFVPPRRPPAPRVASLGARHPIDAFVFAGLESRGLEPSAEAHPATLLRRLSLDLAGLPPTPAETGRFVRDLAEDGTDAAFDRAVDRLLASPAFGERWGRHWLDLARYADSDGFEDDRTRPDAWRFRDWVISAVNRDLPFDRFTVEQLAGDLLPDAAPDERTAAGFHRMSAFNRIAAEIATEEEFRVKRVKERLSTTATAWLGLTMGCAECHDHKYDPLLQREYYRFYAFFNNLEDAQVPAPPLPPRHTREYEESLKKHEAARGHVKRAKEDFEAFQKDEMPRRTAAWAETAERGTLPADVATVVDTPPARRSQAQRDRLLTYFRTIDPEYRRLQRILLQSEVLANNAPNPPSAQALTVAERPQPRPTRLQRRGNFEDLGEELRPGTPECLPPGGGGPATRLELARWIADPGNPLTARVAVNHVWKHLFGRGLVGTPENFGAQGEPPSHPELLDWLAVEFVSGGWSRKRLIRAIVGSSAYRQSSRHRADAAARDPENRLLWRQNRVRVEAEIVRDLALAAGGILNAEVGGPAVQPPLPVSLLGRSDLDNERLMMPSHGADRYRRGVYINVQRTFPYPLLKDFDGTEGNEPCPTRDRSVTPQQALALLNDPVFTECAVAVGVRVVREGPEDDAGRVDFAFRICLARSPGPVERKVLLEVYREHAAHYGADPVAAARLLGPAPIPEGIARAEAAAWAAVGRVLLNTDEFITRE